MGYKRDLRGRNEEIRQIFRHLRKVERRENSYAIEEICRNYHLKPDRIYQIISEDDDPEAIESPSHYYSSIIQKQ